MVQNGCLNLRGKSIITINTQSLQQGQLKHNKKNSRQFSDKDKDNRVTTETEDAAAANTVLCGQSEPA